ncbi:MAG: cupin domain-containing protein [Pseudomonadota bacterium]
MIRTERKLMALTLEEFAALVGTSKATLQRIESGVKSPSVALLSEISQICRKPISDFIHDELGGFRKLEEEDQKKIITRQSKTTIISPYGMISRDVVVNHYEGMPGAHMDPHKEEGREWIYVLKGECEVVHEGKTYNLKKGDVICYDATKLHSYRILTAFEAIRITIRK